MFDEGIIFYGKAFKPYQHMFTYNLPWIERLYSQCFEDYLRFHHIFIGKMPKNQIKEIQRFFSYLLN